MTGALFPPKTETALDNLLPAPRLRETHGVDIALTQARAWQEVRHGNLAAARAINALFTIGELPGRLLRRQPGPERAALSIDDLVSTPAKPGFHLLADNPPDELIVGAIGKVWRLDVPFVHVDDVAAFTAFDEPGYIKVAWAIRLAALGERDTRVTLELRVGATDEAAWRNFRRYFAVIGPGSRFIRRSALSGLARRLGSPDEAENGRPLPGDELLPDAAGQMTHAVTIQASPADIWPWLVQMGCGRGGFYSIDLLDNGGERSAREIHHDLQQIAVGDIFPATPKGDAGFEVLRSAPPAELVLGGLFDQETKRQLPFDAPRPDQYWHVTWAFVLEPRGDTATRLHVRARAAFPDSSRLHAVWLRNLHHLMESAQLRHVAARAEGRLRRDDWRDILDGAAGAAVMAAGLATPFRRRARSQWGVNPTLAKRRYPGDELVPRPRWSWTHGIEVEAAAADVWPWVAQMGTDRGGFYSYQWLENIAGCQVRNAESIHPDWAVRAGGELRVHPKVPPMRVVSVTPGQSLVAFIDSAPGAQPGTENGRGARASRAQHPAAQAGLTGHPAHTRTAGQPAAQSGKGWITASWLFFIEPLGPDRCLVISRYRCATSDDLLSRLRFGPGIIEPIGFAMDRRMLLGIKQRAERRLAG